MGFLSMFFFPSLFLYYDLSFDMQKPSHISNNHQKIHDFFPSSLAVQQFSSSFAFHSPIRRRCTRIKRFSLIFSFLCWRMTNEEGLKLNHKGCKTPKLILFTWGGGVLVLLLLDLLFSVSFYCACTLSLSFNRFYMMCSLPLERCQFQ